ncbi:MAG: glycine cleavage system protein H [Tepidisphaerales bacterium]
MPEYLQTTIDKLTFRVATDRLYAGDGVWAFWIQAEDKNHVRVGLSDFLQQRSGDLAFVSVKPPGTVLAAGDELAELETVKVNVSLISPVGGKVVEINRALELTPEIVNQDPYGKGWLAVIEVGNWENDRARLLDPQAYFSLMRQQAEQELKQP